MVRGRTGCFLWQAGSKKNVFITYPWFIREYFVYYHRGVWQNRGRHVNLEGGLSSFTWEGVGVVMTFVLAKD